MLWLQGQKVVMIVTNITKIDFRRKKTYFISLSKSMYMYNGCAELLSLIVLWSLGKRGASTKKQLQFYKQLGIGYNTCRLKGGSRGYFIIEEKWGLILVHVYIHMWACSGDFEFYIEIPVNHLEITSVSRSKEYRIYIPVCLFSLRFSLLC